MGLQFRFFEKRKRALNFPIKCILVIVLCMGKTYKAHVRYRQYDEHSIEIDSRVTGVFVCLNANKHAHMRQTTTTDEVSQSLVNVFGLFDINFTKCQPVVLSCSIECFTYVFSHFYLFKTIGIFAHKCFLTYIQAHTSIKPHRGIPMCNIYTISIDVMFNFEYFFFLFASFGFLQFNR